MVLIKPSVADPAKVQFKQILAGESGQKYGKSERVHRSSIRPNAGERKGRT